MASEVTIILDTFDPKTGPLTPDYSKADIDTLIAATSVGDEQAIAELIKRADAADGTKDMPLDYWQGIEFKRNFSQAQRDKFAKEGVAMPDGSYPIPDGGALRRAIASIGRATDPEATKKHIIKRAQALHLTWMLPKDWEGSTADGGHS